jgi:hypothetical protein
MQGDPDGITGAIAECETDRQRVGVDWLKARQSIEAKLPWLPDAGRWLIYCPCAAARYWYAESAPDGIGVSAGTPLTGFWR